MRDTVLPAQYLQIALDLASRIARGDLQAGEKLFGRSVLASEYAVSPETIRRALRLLADMKVVEVKPQSGVWVLSTDNARRYLETFKETADTHQLKAELKALTEQSTVLNKQLLEVTAALVKSYDTLSPTSESFPQYEVTVSPTSAVVGKSIGALRFWQSTGGTIIAIRRRNKVMLSPGPYAELYSGDVIVLTGTKSAAEAASKFVTEPNEV